MKTMVFKTVCFAFFAGWFFLISSLSVSAQKPLMKYGKIDIETLKMSSYDKDTTAPALILGDYGETNVKLSLDEGWYYVFTRHQRIKIFKKSAYDLANQKVYLTKYNSKSDRINGLKAVSYNLENGKIVESEMGKSAVFEEEVDNHNFTVNFTIPNVKEGSIIEYTYTIKSPYIFFIPDWSFQSEIPAVWSEYRVSYPEYFEYKKLQKGYLLFNINEYTTKPVTISIMSSERPDPLTGRSAGLSTDKISYSDQVYRYMINNVPAFYAEPYMNAVKNYVSSIEFELGAFNPPQGMTTNFYNSWVKVNEELLKDDQFGIQLKHSGFLKDYVNAIQASTPDSMIKMITAFNFVKHRMRWNNANSFYVSKSLKDAFDKQTGNSADINLLLVLMLKELGLDADPVILSTRENGQLHPAQIMLNKFNYVIAKCTIGQKTYLLDATEKNCPYTLLPYRCLNGTGRIISNKKTDWIDLNSRQKYDYTSMFDLSIGTDGRISGSMNIVLNNYAALVYRNDILSKNSQEDYARDFENENPGVALSKLEIINLDSLYKPLVEKGNIEVSNACMVAGNLLTFNPMLFEQVASNPFKLPKREYPVDYGYPRQYKYVFQYNIPDGYSVEELPPDIYITLPEGKAKFISNVKLLGNKIFVNSILDIHNPLFGSEDYEALKEFYDKVVKREATMLVLKKTS